MRPFALTCIFLAHHTEGSLDDLLAFVRLACDNPKLNRVDVGIDELIRVGNVVERNEKLMVIGDPHAIRKCWTAKIA
jgi:hypothetical protein